MIVLGIPDSIVAEHFDIVVPQEFTDNQPHLHIRKAGKNQYCFLGKADQDSLSANAASRAK